MFVRSLVLPVVALSLVGCAGMTVTRTVTGPDGKTVVTSSDPAEQARIDAEAREQEDYEKAIAEAPRRSPQAPIEVAVFEASVAESLARSLDRKQLNDSLVAELSADPLLRVVRVTGLPSSATRSGASDADRIAAAQAKGLSPDVWILPQVFLEDAVGTSGGKLVSMQAFTLRGNVRSAYGTGAAEPKERGTIFQNVQVVKSAAAAIRSAVVSQLGPNLPDREAVAGLTKARQQKKLDAIKEQAGIKPEDDTNTRLRKLLGMEQPEAEQAATTE
ncbi:hypothetical protein [Corallococcus macrosporus]|uniref:hypothetical protein n=1 Tax=Corallococcus macrosporus TaxID=35 RepID=UPI000309F444|nr:hypothetical protein [Corallococcus macrosporus]